ncbi:MAG: J domain-containing protein [Oculatellaceae cyanobacterium Prado106]|nr:J domain-containing protein [Oculatellaceae cyanobacterium Prado106]
MTQAKQIRSHYDLLGLHPSASVQQIRSAYRDLSKLYHPDTTTLPPAIAITKFQELNEAYATLSNPERRSSYDLKIGYSRYTVIQPLPHLATQRPTMGKPYRSSAYLDPSDRPLSAGEIFALFILGLTLLGCLALVFVVAIARGELSIG